MSAYNRFTNRGDGDGSDDDATRPKDSGDVDGEGDGDGDRQSIDREYRVAKNQGVDLTREFTDHLHDGRDSVDEGQSDEAYGYDDFDHDFDDGFDDDDDDDGDTASLISIVSGHTEQPTPGGEQKRPSVGDQLVLLPGRVQDDQGDVEPAPWAVVLQEGVSEVHHGPGAAGGGAAGRGNELKSVFDSDGQRRLYELERFYKLRQRLPFEEVLRHLDLVLHEPLCCLGRDQRLVRPIQHQDPIPDPHLLQARGTCDEEHDRGGAAGVCVQ
ncbi:hypothetical protein PMKS-003472 [Pichia membranifaciens]|uniref:Uncharacterized protein n=1 Tax=Pichia membranifaciens TaxID=4926 RepID=A0A1Q2YK80_9ASCO|nr:hypothetical protein PMKS-003472 [Pichia membranifaciens]